MQYTENYQYRKPVIGVDDADIKDINFNSDKTDTLIYNTQISLAPAYDLNETYDTGDVVMYETLMYKCKADNTTGAWDASKWERTTAGEEGAGGGGGSSVVPNPQGTPTETLNTIGIDGTIFDIAGSGGGGGSAYEETTLWSGSDSASMTLSESFENYDAILFIGKATSNGINYVMTNIWSVEDLKAYINEGSRLCAVANDAWYEYITISNNTTFTRQDRNTLYISEIRGLKLGWGATGGGLERTLLWDYVTDNNNVIPYGLYTETLHDNINNYDFIVAEIVSASGDLSASGWKSTNLWIIDVNALNNTEVQNYLNYTSFGERSSRFYIKDTTFQKTTNNQANTNGLVRVYGLKWTGGGSGGGYSETSLYTYTGSTRQTTLSLSDAYTDYDAIEFTFGWNLGGTDFETINVISSSKIVSNVFVNVGGEGRYNYVSRGSADNEIILATATGSWDGSSIIREVRGINY